MVLCFWVLAGDNIPQKLMAWKIFHVISPLLACHFWYSSNFPLYYMMVVQHVSIQSPASSTLENHQQNGTCTDDFQIDGEYWRKPIKDNQGNGCNLIELDDIEKYNVDIEDKDVSKNVKSKFKVNLPRYKQITDRYADGKDRVNRGVVYIILLYAILLILDIVYLGVVLIPTLIKCLNKNGSKIPSECDGWTSENNGKVLFGFTVFFSISHIMSEIAVILTTFLKKSQSYEIFIKEHTE
jgi:hypothetical protein